tara:strand:+ start:416 stop:703 length:288 start_codon:yes stop_codon:yes gene_type:complete
MRLSNKLAKAKLKEGNCTITIDGVTEYKRSDIDGRWGMNLTTIDVTSKGTALFSDLGEGMNIEKLGVKLMHLFTYDLVGNRTSAKIEYSRINFLD